MIIDESTYLRHYGVLRRSGRYPWGSGGPERASNKGFLDYADTLRKSGLSEPDVAKAMGITTTQLRAARSIAKNEQKQAQINEAQRYRDKGMAYTAIGRRMNLNESSVRALLAPGQKDKADVLEATANMLKDQVSKKTFIDVGTGVEFHVPVPGLSETKLKIAVARLQEEGYTVHPVKIEQVGTGKMTTMKVLCPPGTTQKEAWMNRHNIKQVSDTYTEDGGRTWGHIEPPTSIKSSRVAVRYAEQGGKDADGVIYVRPGVEDVSLGSSRYAQVRIAVDGTHYLKGMAMYKDDLPEGTDLMFNTNKSDSGNKKDAMKPLKDDKDNPFGASISRQHGVMNVVNEEGDWDTWSKNLSSQMLSKQNRQLAKQQLNMTYETKKNQLDEILKLTNPAVKKKLLEDLADDADGAAVHLKAAHLPRQESRVILPINTMKETEVYAPTFRNGERVVLIRHPHGGTFEIPELTVNNRHPEAKKLLADTRDAIGINHKVAEKLSGADFDGDSVIVIPNNKGSVKSSPSLEGLKTFDPHREYAPYDGMRTIDGGTWNEKTKSVDYGPKGASPRPKQTQMGDISNLITDMTIKGAPHSELVRAVRHSMVVIDAEKHSLNVKQSAINNGISALKEKYQGSKRGGAATVISRKKHEVDVPERKQGYSIDPATGRKIYRETGATTKDKQGNVVRKTQKVSKILEVKDVNELSSGMPIEKVYADHANRLKELANTARRESLHTGNIQRSPSAAKHYGPEVESLNAKLNIALRNRPLERQAQVVANAQIHAKRRANPGMDATQLKKVKASALAEARTRLGAKKEKIEITPSEWDAIQAGAISTHKLEQILNNTKIEQVKELATPKTRLLMTPSKIGRAKSMADDGYTQSEIADALGVSVTTLKTSLSESG